MKIGFLGLGTMGEPMARRLLEAGNEVTVHNRTRSREEPLAAMGAKRAENPRACAEGNDVLFTIVSDTPDLEQVLLGPDGAAEGLGRGTVLVDMSTVSPAATRRLSQELGSRGVSMLDAPVSGGSEGAQQGTLSIMVGGPEEALERVRPLLGVLGKTVTRVGDSGAGQIAKAVNQVLIAGTYAAVAEGMALAQKSGVDPDALLQAVSGGAAGSWVLTNRARNMLAGDYPLGFRTRLHRKDLGIALAEARDLGVSMPVAAYVEQLETGLIGRGYGDEDVSNVARVIREMAGLDS